MTVQITQIDTRRDDVGSALEELRAKLSPRGDVVSDRGRAKTIEVFGQPLTPQQVVETICRDVRQRGMEAVLDYTRKLDGAELTPDTLRVPDAQLEAAHRRTEPALLAAVRRIRDNIREFQQAILHQDVTVERSDGVYLRQRYIPLDRAGICVPGGAAAYPSTVLMTVVPAQTAGVEQLAVVAPPTPFGADNSDVLATCHELGIRDVYRIGRRKASRRWPMASMACRRSTRSSGRGTCSWPWPSGMYLASAISIRSPDPAKWWSSRTRQRSLDFLPRELLAQAEHSPGASILITWNPGLLQATRTALDLQAARLSRGNLTAESLAQFGALILARDADEACQLTDAIAPEHLHIATSDAHALAAHIRHAGATFVGHFTPVAVGDYVAGPSTFCRPVVPHGGPPA